jgi:hypothetical protein
MKQCLIFMCFSEFPCVAYRCVIHSERTSRHMKHERNQARTIRKLQKDLTCPIACRSHVNERRLPCIHRHVCRMFDHKTNLNIWSVSTDWRKAALHVSVKISSRKSLILEPGSTRCCSRESEDRHDMTVSRDYVMEREKIVKF